MFRLPDAMAKALWVIFLALLPWQVSAQSVNWNGSERRWQDRIMIGSDLIVREDETVQDVVVIAGNANINGTVEGSVTVIGGSLTLNGTVRQNLTVALGKGVISEEAEVGGETHLVGGPFVVHPNATLMQELTEFNLGDLAPKIEWFKAWMFQGLVLGRPIAPGLEWTWYAAAIFLGIYFLIGAAFPQPILASVSAAENNPVTALLTGLLGLFLLGPLCLLLVISLVGILTIPFLMCGIFLAFMFGKTAIFGLVGKSLARAVGLPRFPLAFAVLAGGILLGITYVVPVLGMLMWGASAIVGFGSVILAISQSLQKEAASMPPVAIQPKPSRSGQPVLPASPSSSFSSAAAPTVAAVPSNTDVLLLQRAGFWRRMVAGFLDLILLSFTAPLVNAALPLVFLLYLLAMWTVWGSTVGGMIMGIKIVRVDGKPLNLGIALVRALSSFFSALVFFLGFLWIAWDREKQGWHDKIAGTTVVRLPQGQWILL